MAKFVNGNAQEMETPFEVGWGGVEWGGAVLLGPKRCGKSVRKLLPPISRNVVTGNARKLGFHEFWVFWKVGSSPNTSKLVCRPPDWSSDFLIKATASSLALSN